MKISVIIPNYNGEKQLEANLSTVLSCGIDGEIIVVDDASTDKSVKLLKDQFPQVKVIEKKKNEGFASSANIGVKAAKYSLVLLINTDVAPEKIFLQYLIPHFSDSRVFAVGCCQKSIENGKIVLRGRGIGSFKRGFLVHQRGEVDKNNTLWVSGGAGMFRKNIWEKLGGMNSLYNPFYWEDIDLSYRALKAGYKILFEPRSYVFHHHDQSVIKGSFREDMVKSIAYRNQIIFVWLNITDISLLVGHLIYLPYYLLKALVSLDFAFIKGFFGALGLIPAVFRKRQSNKRLFKISDQDVLKMASLC